MTDEGSKPSPLSPGTDSSNPAPSSSESTANPVGLAQVEWPVRRRRSPWQGAALRLANPCGISGVANTPSSLERATAISA